MHDYESLPATVDGRQPRRLAPGDELARTPNGRPVVIRPRSLVVSGVRPRARIEHPEDAAADKAARMDRLARVKMAHPLPRPRRRLSRETARRVELAAWSGVIGAGIGVALAALLDSIR